MYSLFEPALEQMIRPHVGPIGKFVDVLQRSLDSKLSPPEAPAPSEISDLLREASVTAYQAPLFDDIGSANHDHVVNVASVPKRNPFRYPGGKTWLVPHIRRWTMSRPRLPRVFFEPFAGGGIVSLTVAAERLADHVVMVEIDQDVGAVWQTILSDDGAEWLAERIMSFDLTHDNVREVLAQNAPSLRERAFGTLLRNRVLHGGILAPGSGLIKYGENGRVWVPAGIQKRLAGASWPLRRFGSASNSSGVRASG